jgi:hypothetical protein
LGVLFGDVTVPDGPGDPVFVVPFGDNAAFFEPASAEGPIEE